MLQKGVLLKYSMKWGIVEGDLPTTSSDNAIKEGIRYYFKDKIPKVLLETSQELRMLSRSLSDCQSTI